MIQFAKLSGFSPIITTASPRHTARLQALGATHVVDRALALPQRQLLEPQDLQLAERHRRQHDADVWERAAHGELEHNVWLRFRVLCLLQRLHGAPSPQRVLSHGTDEVKRSDGHR